LGWLELELRKTKIQAALSLESYRLQIIKNLDWSRQGSKTFCKKKKLSNLKNLCSKAVLEEGSKRRPFLGKGGSWGQDGPRAWL
jgi:hypothetical protein